MKRLVFALVFMFVLQALWVGAVAAESSSYNAENDITLSFTVAEDEVETSDETGQATFEAQEEVHQTFTDNSGEEVEHFYVWVEINGSRVLAVDPPRPCFN